MQIPVYDYTTHWNALIVESVNRWNAALAYRGIVLVYQKGIPGTAGQCDLGQMAINCCDSLPPVANHIADSWVWVGTFTGSYSRYYVVPTATDFYQAASVHEFGHCLGLNHSTGDTVMTPLPSLGYPSQSDAMQAMPGYPLPVVAPPAAQPPTTPVGHDHHKNKKHGSKHH